MAQAIFHIFLPIFLGGSIYALFRGFHFIDPYEIYFPLFQLDKDCWLIYSGPDGLWLYALLMSLSIIWRGQNSWQFWFWIITAFSLSCFSETLQYYQWIPGTFDWNDIFAYFIALILVVLKAIGARFTHK